MLAISPFTLAAENTLLLCPLHREFDVLQNEGGGNDAQSDIADLAQEEDEDSLKFLLEIMDLATLEQIGKADCGKTNPGTGFIEKRDCTADDGKVITEVGEIFGPDIEEDAEGNEIQTVYKGVCCLITDKTGGECLETRTVYTEDFSSCTDKASYCQRKQWIIGRTGVGIVKVYVKQLYIYGAGIIGFVSVVTMVISGIQIQVSGVSGDITSAKERIFKALGGLVLLFLSGLILYTINPTFFS